MAAYVAMARVERGRIRALAWDESLRRDHTPAEAVPATTAATAATAATPATAAATASLEPDDATSFGEQLERLRDQVSMVTFYLTDPESWR